MVKKIYEIKAKGISYGLPLIHQNTLIFQEYFSQGKGHLYFYNIASGKSSTVDLEYSLTNIYAIDENSILVEDFNRQIKTIHINKQKITNSWFSEGINLVRETKFSAPYSSGNILATKFVEPLNYQYGVMNLKQRTFKSMLNGFIPLTIINSFIFGIHRENGLIAKFDVETLFCTWKYKFTEHSIKYIPVIIDTFKDNVILYDIKFNILYCLDSNTGIIKWREEIYRLISKFINNEKVNFNVSMDKILKKIYFTSSYYLFEFDVKKLEISYFKSFKGILTIKNFIADDRNLYLIGNNNKSSLLLVFDILEREVKFLNNFDYELANYPMVFNKYLLLKGNGNEICIFEKKYEKRKKSKLWTESP